MRCDNNYLAQDNMLNTAKDVKEELPPSKLIQTHLATEKEDKILSTRLKFHNRSIEMVALATIMRTGNSWIRRLVEIASGIVTEAVYRREGPFTTPDNTWFKTTGHSGKANRSVVDGEYALVKIHESEDTPYFSLSNFVKVVRVVRFPLDILPWLCFQSQYGKKECPDLDRFANYCYRWASFHFHWNCHPGPQLLIRFEDLLSNTECVLRKILDFLEYDYTDETIAAAIAKYPATNKTERLKMERNPGWTVPGPYLDFAINFFEEIFYELGYSEYLEEVKNYKKKYSNMEISTTSTTNEKYLTHLFNPSAPSFNNSVDFNTTTFIARQYRKGIDCLDKYVVHCFDFEKQLVHSTLLAQRQKEINNMLPFL
eukprot:CAMPEP_0174264632 /NCGR_PEP_ID=MMETSP0439-20130205/23217_1 /TAXON_ID=0 /ORGANISM="Stereomyxa ramosa, Strain Chinc5" /LENGTH=369 /DNA_ID=CAMNT_0015350615 /DNA_START=316 /DNA_END=1425 /DNA_ORIENTATION=+